MIWDQNNSFQNPLMWPFTYSTKWFKIYIFRRRKKNILKCVCRKNAHFFLQMNQSHSNWVVLFLGSSCHFILLSGRSLKVLAVIPKGTFAANTKPVVIQQNTVPSVMILFTTATRRQDKPSDCCVGISRSMYKKNKKQKKWWGAGCVLRCEERPKKECRVSMIHKTE